MDNSRLEIDFGTSQLKRPSSVTVPVNGQRLQTLRQSAGLTQEELAEKADYSDRLIRKAEASGPLRKSTIADLAEALSTTLQKVTSDDLVFSRDLIARDIAAFILNGSLSPALEIWWFIKIHFEANRLVSMEMLYDTGNVCRLLGCFQK
jgi:transcriptional regulator with XRE-family HTH domain